MITVYPDYLKEFECIASACRHNCCIGWEIDIDEDTLKKYAGITGNLGSRLKENISGGDEPHFILAENERCPFLNSDNLCDLILYGGENMLCQICTDHPRFRNFLPGRTEIGLGLCCEAAGKLIISRTAPVTLISEGSNEEIDKDSEFLLNLRKKAFSAAQNRTKPICERCRKILSLCSASFPSLSVPDLCDLYLSLERLDKRWTDILANLKANYKVIDSSSFLSYMSGRETEYEQLLVYFIYRHFLSAYDDGDIESKATFAVMSVYLIYLLGALHFADIGSFSIDDQIELARMYSSEIEYSQENLDTLFDAFYAAEE